MRPHLAFATSTALQPAPDVLRVLVVSKAPLVRAGLITMLGGYRDLDLTEAGPAEVLLGDEPLPDAGVPAVILVADAAAAAAALASGARGVLPRSAAPRRMHAALHAVAESELVIDETFAHVLLRRTRPAVAMIAPLTPREREVLPLLAAGMTNKEIASRLGVTDHTVKFHVNGILGKLGAVTRTEAVVEAARRGLIAV
jgi:two-component system, NarL family, nitrate/nitrite response regulator NarL